MSIDRTPIVSTRHVSIIARGSIVMSCDESTEKWTNENAFESHSIPPVKNKGRTIRFLRGGVGRIWKKISYRLRNKKKKNFYLESSKKNISCRNGEVKKSCKLTFLSTELFT